MINHIGCVHGFFRCDTIIEKIHLLFIFCHLKGEHNSQYYLIKYPTDSFHPHILWLMTIYEKSPPPPILYSCKMTVTSVTVRITIKLVLAAEKSAM